MGDNTMRCPVCKSPLRAIGNTTDPATNKNAVKLTCLTMRLPTNNNNPCPRYGGGANPDPELITLVVT